MLKYFHANVFPSAFTNGLSCPPVQSSLSCSLIAGTHVITSFCLQARLEIVSVWYGTRSSPSALPPHQRGQASDAQTALNLLGNSVVHGPWRVAWRGRNTKQGAGDLFQYFAEVVQQFLTKTEKQKMQQTCSPQFSAGLEPIHQHTGVWALLPLMGPDLLSRVPTATTKQSHSSFSAVNAD